jgi:hypothetical protein
MLIGPIKWIQDDGDRNSVQARDVVFVDDILLLRLLSHFQAMPLVLDFGAIGQAPHAPFHSVGLGRPQNQEKKRNHA